MTGDFKEFENNGYNGGGGDEETDGDEDIFRFSSSWLNNEEGPNKGEVLTKEFVGENADLIKFC